MSRTLTEAERIPHQIKNKFDESWFYVGKGTCYFLARFEDGRVRELSVPTRTIRAALAQMDKQLAAREGK